METLLFWTLPVLAVVLGLKGRFILGWRLFLCSATALYAGVWLAPAWWQLLDFLPAEAEAYRKGIAVLAGCVVLFALLYYAAKAGVRCGDEDLNFPAIPAKVLNALCRFGFGVCVSTLLMLLCAMTPLRLFMRNDGAGFEERAEAAMLSVTSVGDKLTHTKASKPRAEALAEFRFVPPAEAEAAAEPEPAQTPENNAKTNAPAAPAE